jgi:hypothetical protein
MGTTACVTSLCMADVASPSSDAPVVSTAAAETPAVAPITPTPEVSPAAPVETAPVAGAETAPVSDAAPTPTPPSADAPKTDAVSPDAKPAEEKPAEAEKPAVPVYAEFKMPEGFKAEAEKIQGYTNILGKYGVSQEAGQELIDFHASQMKQYADQVSRQQVDTFNDTQRQWVKDIDKEFGNKRDTAIGNAKWVIDQYGGSKQQKQELWDVLNFTGAGNHKAMIRTLNNVAKQLRERDAPPISQAAPAKSGNPADRRYGRTA